MKVRVEVEIGRGGKAPIVCNGRTHTQASTNVPS